MKKLFALLFICGILTSSLQAQRGIHIGFTGVSSAVFILNQNNYETLDGCPVISRSELDYTSKWGYNIGGVLGFNFNKNMGIQTGVRYVRTGQNYEDTFNPGTQFCPTPYHVVREVDLRYIRVPLQFRYKYAFANPKFKLFAYAGPYIGWLVKASESVVVNDVERTDLTPTIDKFSYTDVGLSFGVGGEYFMTKNLYLSLGLAGEFGIKDMNGRTVKDLEWFSKNDVGYNKSRNFNVGLSIGIHYIFNPGSQNPFKPKKGETSPPSDVTK